MSDPAAPAGSGFSPLGNAGRSSNTSGNVGLAGSALLPTITAELRSEFHPLLSALASSGSDISATYIMELLFTLVRVDAVLHSDERHLLVSTSQQLITKQLRQLQTVHNKVKLLDENIRFVEELIERCAALQFLCGSREEVIDDAADDAAEMATTAPDIGTGTEDEEAGSTDNEEDAGGEPAALRRQRVATSGEAKAALRGRNRNSPLNTTRSTASSANRQRYFSFDGDLDALIDRSNNASAAQRQQQERKRAGEKRGPKATCSTGGDTNNFTVSLTTKLLRQQHRQHTPPQPLPPTIDATPTAAAATPAGCGTLKSDVTLDALTPPDDNDEGSAVRDGAGPCGDSSKSNVNANTSATPAVCAGVQQALQEHFRQSVKRNLTGFAWATPCGPGSSECPTAPALGDASASASYKEKAAAGCISSLQPPSSTGPPRPPPPASLRSTTTINSNSLHPGLVAASSANQINMLSVDGGGGGGSLYLSVHSSPRHDPVDTARVWDRMFWDFLDGRTATADLVVLLSLLNDDSAALAALQTSEMDKRCTGNESMAATTASSISASKAGTKTSGYGVGASSSRLAGLNRDPTTKAVAATATPTPECGALPLMQALKLTGSYAELLPAPMLSNMSIASAAAAAAAGVSLPAIVGVAAAEDAAFLRIRRDRAGEQTEDEELARSAYCTSDTPVLYAVNSAMANLRGDSGSGNVVQDLSNVDSLALRPSPPPPQQSPQQWINLDDYAMAEEARLHRDFWAHVPAILVTLAEGLMYGDDHNRNSADAQGKAGSDDTSSANGDNSPRQQKQRTSTATTALPAEAGGEVADAPANASFLYDSADLRDSHDSTGDGERWREVTSQKDRTAESVGEEEAAVFVPLHPPSSAALQLLPILSPQLRNYTRAMEHLFQAAPEYARSTQVQHARALANAVAQQQQQVQQLGTPGSNDPNVVSRFTSASELAEVGNAVTTTTGGVAVDSGSTNVMRGLTRAATHRSSVTDLQEMNEIAYYYHKNGVDRRGTTPPPSGGNCNSGNGTGKSTQPSLLPSTAATATAAAAAVSPEPADLGLLGDGSRTEVRPVDVVMYALVTAVYVQCAVPLEHYHRRQMTHGGGKDVSGADGRSTAIPHVSGPDGKTSPSESLCSPIGGPSPQLGLGWPNGAQLISPGMSFAGDGTGPVDGAAEDERTTNLFTNGSLSYAANAVASNFSGAPGCWGTGGGGRGNLPSNTSFGLSSHLPRPAQLQSLNVFSGSRLDNASFAALMLQPQNLSFDLSRSPTEAALSLLRNVHEDRADGAIHGAPLSMHFALQNVLACAMEFSWVSLPSIMKAELQNLHAQLQATRNAVQRMEGQVRGELALLLFRVLSMVLDWLMPAVYVADPRIWLFYRKWCCDLYRVLCTDLNLLNEFCKLLNQSGVAVIAANPGGGAEASRTREGRRAASVTSAATTPIHKPARVKRHAFTPPRPTRQLGSPVLSTGAPVAKTRTGGGLDTARTGSASTEISEGATVASPYRREEQHGSSSDKDAEADRGVHSSNSSNDGNDGYNNNNSADSDDANLFSFILPGSSLAVSVSQATPPLQPGVVDLLAQEEADRRGETPAGVTFLRAAQALLSDEGKVVPLPKPFLITKLVAATLRGIDADIAESLLWVVGRATETSHVPAEERATVDLMLQRASTGGSGAFISTPAAAPHTDDMHSSSSHGPAAGNVQSTAQWRSQHLRYGTRTPQQSSNSNNGRRSSSADVRAIGNRRRSSAPCHLDPSTAAGMVSSPQYGEDLTEDDYDDSDSDDVQRLSRLYSGRQWYSEKTSGRGARRRRARLPPAPAQSPVAASPSGNGSSNYGGGMPPISPVPLFPIVAPRTPFPAAGLSQQRSPPTQAAAIPEGPMLVHHHRFRYPSISGYADVAQLYLSTLEDAELLLSPHDPIYASLVLSTADLHVHDLGDHEMAAMLVNSYLADVGKEQIQSPVWDVLPTTLMPMSSTGNSAAAGSGTSITVSFPPSSEAPPAPGRGFSVTRVRQGNAGVGAGWSFSGTNASSSPNPHSLAHPPAPQQPYVPMVVPSWNDEQEKNEFLSTLRVLRQMQAFLAQL
ncbi:hypothetical protein ABL78_0942 [Leptomonas seymouri]|uniref:Uncharacterized protein n=1 Tax=Leptomonas seymouri TaxID=5684 RepID=A0A0N1I2Y8_LEPSE|nr:hypothetical protein ABL78_0942 [Leptomonas seymouri]|eukprot:KPI89974.1 hypothetical protein ABL78_0942 [Leptomonas seymouri]